MLAMLICFFTAIILAAYAPYEEKQNNQLAQLCQAIIFFLFLSAAILEELPGNPFLDVTQVTLLVLVALYFFVSELFVPTHGSSDAQKPTAVARATRRLQAKVVKALDAYIGLKKVPAQEVKAQEAGFAAEERKVLTA